MGFEGAETRAGETWGGTSVKLIDRGEGEDEGGVDALDEDWIAESTGPADLMGAAGEGNEAGN